MEPKTVLWEKTVIWWGANSRSPRPPNSLAQILLKHHYFGIIWNRNFEIWNFIVFSPSKLQKWDASFPYPPFPFTVDRQKLYQYIGTNSKRFGNFEIWNSIVSSMFELQKRGASPPTLTENFLPTKHLIRILSCSYQTNWPSNRWILYITLCAVGVMLSGFYVLNLFEECFLISELRIN